MDGGDAPVAVLTAALPPGIAVTAEDRAPLDTVTGYRDVLYGAGAVVLLLGLASLLISGIDRAMERRRHLAALTLLGVPQRVVRGSQLSAGGGTPGCRVAARRRRGSPRRHGVSDLDRVTRRHAIGGGDHADPGLRRARRVVRVGAGGR